MRLCIVRFWLLGAAGILWSASALGAEPSAASGWQGCYVGAQLGYANGRARTVDAPFVQGPSAGLGFAWNTPAGETIRSDDDGVIGGGQVGCDIAIAVEGVTLVLGGAADMAALDIAVAGVSQLSPDTETRLSVDWASTLRARVGFASPGLLVYATGGVAFARIDARAIDDSVTPSPGLMDVSESGTEIGWAAGAGAEAKIAPHVSVSFEYLHLDFDDVTATGVATVPATAFPRFESELEIETVRVGVNWRM